MIIYDKIRDEKLQCDIKLNLVDFSGGLFRG